MAQHRRKFSPQFKAEAIQFVLQTGRPVTQIVRELEIDKGTLSNWVSAWKIKNPEPSKALIPMESAAVAEYIEVFYNRKCLHSTLGYQTPSDVLCSLLCRDLRGIVKPKNERRTVQVS